MVSEDTLSRSVGLTRTLCVITAINEVTCSVRVSLRIGIRDQHNPEYQTKRVAQPSEEDLDDCTLYNVNSVANAPPISVEIRLDDCLVKMEVDTGASLSLMEVDTGASLSLMAESTFVCLVH